MQDSLRKAKLSDMQTHSVGRGKLRKGGPGICWAPRQWVGLVSGLKLQHAGIEAIPKSNLRPGPAGYRDKGSFGKLSHPLHKCRTHTNIDVHDLANISSRLNSEAV